jgi:hypothetical protein
MFDRMVAGEYLPASLQVLDPVRRILVEDIVDRALLVARRYPSASGGIDGAEYALLYNHRLPGAHMQTLVRTIEDRRFAHPREGYAAVAADREASEIIMSDLVAQLESGVIKIDIIADNRCMRRKDAVLIKGAVPPYIENGAVRYGFDLGRIFCIQIDIPYP